MDKRLDAGHFIFHVKILLGSVVYFHVGKKKIPLEGLDWSLDENFIISVIGM